MVSDPEGERPGTNPAVVLRYVVASSLRDPDLDRADRFRGARFRAHTFEARALAGPRKSFCVRDDAGMRP
jgi:hypothetical protein